MKRFAWLVVGMLAVSLVAGCLETTQVVTLNPDGSGKVVFKTIAPSMNFMQPKNEKADPDKAARDAMADLIKTSKGVDAWADLVCKPTDDGKNETSGVAYFSDFSKLHLQPFSDNNGKWTVAGNAGTLEFRMDKKSAASKPEPKAMTDEEVAAAIKAARAQYQQTRQMMAAFMGTLKVDMTYILPGTLGEVQGFTKTDKGGVQMVMEGKKVLEVMDKYMADDKVLATALRAGRDLQKDGPGEEVVMEGMFGKKLTALTATCTDMKPQFDYAAEMGKAKAGQADLLKKLNIDLTAKPAPTFNGPPGGAN